MATVIGVVGSPRREIGLTHQVVTAALAGAEAAGAETSVQYLVDWPLGYCVHCGASCFADGRCIQSEEANELSAIIGAADAIVLGAPVYAWHLSGLTHVFMDRYRIRGGATLARRPNGKPAIAVAVAGGTGTGVFGALRSLLNFYCLWSYRALDAIPVTRYNLEEALEQARVAGRALAEAAPTPRPFADAAELFTYYDDPRWRYGGHVEEMVWLAEHAVTLGYSEAAEVARLCREARALLGEERIGEAARLALQAFETARGKL